MADAAAGLGARMAQGESLLAELAGMTAAERAAHERARELVHALPGLRLALGRPEMIGGTRRWGQGTSAILGGFDSAEEAEKAAAWLREMLASELSAHAAALLGARETREAEAGRGGWVPRWLAGLFGRPAGYFGTVR